MSEPNGTAPMDSVAGLIPVHLGKLAEAGKLRDALELIKFLRRYIPCRTLTHYRTVDRPDAIVAYLKDCGLVERTPETVAFDFTVEESTLDPTSFVIKFALNDLIKRFLSELADLRVERGPSVCDRLYCELIKDSGRDFAAAIKAGPPKRRENIPIWAVKRTTEVLSEIVTESALGADSQTEKERAIAKWAESLLKDGKLDPKAPPILPLAVAERYAILLGFPDYTGEHPGPRDGIFAFPEGREADIAARPIRLEEDDIPLRAPAGIPVGLMRKLSQRFRDFTCADAYSFARCVGDYRENADAVYVAASCRLRVPDDNPGSLLKAYEFIRNDLMFWDYVNAIYATCYPEFRMTFDKGSRISSSFLWENANLYDLDPDEAVLAKPKRDFTEAEIKDDEADREAGFGEDVDDPGFMATCAFVLAPRECAQPTSEMFQYSSRSNPTSSIVLRDKSKEEPRQDRLARLWFRAVHGYEFPETKDKDPYDIETEIASLDAAVGSRTKTVLDHAARICREKSEKAYESHAEVKEGLAYKTGACREDGLHSNKNFCTQVMTFVTGGKKSLTEYVRETEKGSVVIPPNLVVDRTDDPVENEAFGKFAGLCGTTNVQVRPVKRVEHFNAVIETNILHYRIQGLYTPAIASNFIYSVVDREKLEKVKNRLMPGKARAAAQGILDFWGDSCAACRGDLPDYVSSGFKVDSQKRASIVLRFKPIIGLLVLLASLEGDESESAADDRRLLQELLENADDEILRLDKSNWTKDAWIQLLKEKKCRSCRRELVNYLNYRRGNPDTEFQAYRPTPMFGECRIGKFYDTVDLNAIIDPN